MTKFWRHFSSNGLSRRIERRLGVFGHPAAVTPGLKRRLGLTSSRGFVVRLVLPDSPAHAAGLIEDDVVVSLAESPVRDTASLHRLLGRLPADLPLALVLVRDGRKLERWVLLNGRTDWQRTQTN